MNELNAKVAGILRTQRPIHLCGYDSDPALLPEMLAWLHERWGNVELHIGRSDTMAAVLVGNPVLGKSPNEAVARLVVAVAEEKP